MQLWVLEGGDGQDVPQAQRERDLLLNNEREWDSEEDDDGDEPQEAPPPAPEPPRPGRPRAPVVNMIVPQVVPHEAVQLPPALDRPPDRRHHEEAPVNVLHQWRADRLQRRQGGGAPGGGRVPDLQGMRRFLDMVNNDEEDEWDSDELDEEAGHEVDWEIPVR